MMSGAANLNCGTVNQNTTVDGRVEYADRGCSTQEPLIDADLLNALDEPSCSTQQEPMSKEYNRKNNFAIYDMDSPRGYKLKISKTGFKKTSSKEKKVDLPTKFNVSCYYKIQIIS